MGYTINWDFLDYSSVKLLGSLVTELAIGYRATISRVFLSILEGGCLPAGQLSVSVPFLILFRSLSLTSLLTRVLFSKIQSEALRPVMLPPSLHNVICTAIPPSAGHSAKDFYQASGSNHFRNGSAIPFSLGQEASSKISKDG